MIVHFSEVSRRKALLELEGNRNSFGLVRNPVQRHGLGLREAPRFRVTQPFSPDDGWRFEPHEPARDVPDTWSPGSELERGLMGWVKGSAAKRGLSVLTALPRGRYLLLRSGRRPVASERALMGNDLLLRPPNVLVLRQEEPLFVGVVGSRKDEPPALD